MPHNRIYPFARCEFRLIGAHGPRVSIGRDRQRAAAD